MRKPTVQRMMDHYNAKTTEYLEAVMAETRQEIRYREEIGLKPRVHTMKRLQALKFVIASRLAPEYAKA